MYSSMLSPILVGVDRAETHCSAQRGQRALATAAVRDDEGCHFGDVGLHACIPDKDGNKFWFILRNDELMKF